MSKFVKQGLFIAVIMAALFFGIVYWNSQNNKATVLECEKNTRNPISAAENCKGVSGFPLAYDLGGKEGIFWPFFLLDYIFIPLAIGFGISFIKNRVVKK